MAELLVIGLPFLILIGTVIVFTLGYFIGKGAGYKSAIKDGIKI